MLHQNKWQYRLRCFGHWATVLCRGASAHLPMLLGDSMWKGLSTWSQGTAVRLAAETPKWGRKMLWQKRAQKPQRLESNHTLPKAIGTFLASIPTATSREPWGALVPWYHLCAFLHVNLLPLKVTWAMLPGLSLSTWDTRAQGGTFKGQEDFSFFFFFNKDKGNISWNI